MSVSYNVAGNGDGAGAAVVVVVVGGGGDGVFEGVGDVDVDVDDQYIQQEVTSAWWTGRDGTGVRHAG